MNLISESLSQSAILATSESDQALLADLRARWPILNEPKPLKRGIRQDIRAALNGVSGVKIARALLLHAATAEYQAALAAGGPRFDLDGLPAGEVSATERRHAQAILEGKAAMPTGKGRKKPKRQKAAKHTSPPQSQTQAAPPAAPSIPPVEAAQQKSEPTAPPAVTPPQPVDTPPARPILKLKPKSGPVTTATITRKEPK